ncbi:unnamed protein product [Bemisia tabaci]|uniref:AAA-ATPase-like domain-containing protein n=1 Tax=Bemisia tabaci TaxID=7038 RepID=A0A9P0AC89_BEMTA|nr:unnamed protein product [Bemisia tabaci]
MKQPLSVILTLFALHQYEAADPYAGDFARVRHSKTFVDKTNFIGLFLNMSHSTIHISVPPKFGKSVNLDMLRLYLDAPVKVGNETTANNQYTDTLFLGTKFHGNPHFGDHYLKYKVVHVDFSPFKIVEDVETFNRSLAEVVCQMHEKYGSHLNFSYIDGKKAPPQACLDYHREKKLSILDAGQQLISDIYFAFSKPIIVLIDNFDAILHNYMIGPVRHKEKIHKYFGHFLRGLVQDSPEVNKSLMVGSLTLGGVLATLTNDTKHLFPFENGTVAQYFGFTGQDVDNLLDTFQIREKNAQLRSLYMGYRVLDSPNLTLYNPLSITDFLEQRWHTNSSNLFKGLDGCDRILENVVIGREVERVAYTVGKKRKHLPQRYTFSNGRLAFQHVDRLHRGMRSKINTFASVDDINLFMQYLFEFGYFSIVHARVVTSELDMVTIIEDVVLTPATLEARKVLRKYLTASNYYQFVLGKTWDQLNAFGEFLLDLPGKEVFHDLAVATHKIFNRTWDEVSWPVSMTGAMEAIFAHNATLAKQYPAVHFELVVEREADGFDCSNELDVFLVTGKSVGIIIENRQGIEHKLASNTFYAMLDRGCEDVYEHMRPRILVKTKIAMLINLTPSRHCEIFYRVTDQKQGDPLWGFAQHPLGEILEFEETKKPDDPGMKSKFDLETQKMLEEAMRKSQKYNVSSGLGV